MFRKNFQKLKDLEDLRRASDKVFIHGLVVNAIIGIFEWERNNKQRIIVDVDMVWDNRPAARSEDIHLALDYKKVSEAIEELIIKSEFFLVETMAEHVAHLLQETFNVVGAKVRITKPDALSHIEGVGVEIIRGSFR